MTDLRVAFLGNALWSVPSLRALAGSRHPVVHVATLPPRPGRRGGPAQPTPVAEAARALGLDLTESATVVSGSGRRALEEASPDVIVVVAFGELLSDEVITLAPLGALNLHLSLLPEYRGAAPVQRALIEGQARTGVSIMQIDGGLDTGPVFARAAVDIEPDDDAGSLGARLAGVGAELLCDVLDLLAEGDADPEEQDSRKATYAAKIGAADRQIDWTLPAMAVVDLVRGCAPTPGAVTTRSGAVLKVLRATAAAANDPRPSAPPGSILDPTAPSVIAGDGVVILEEVSPEGRARMNGGAFARGAGLVPGERLGAG